MYDLDELKESMKNPEFRFVIRKNIIDALGQPKSKPKDEIDLILSKLKGTGLTLKDIPNFIESFKFMVFLFDNKEILGDLISDLDTTELEAKTREFLIIINELEK